MKRIVTVQDISCIGKCSLTAALPIISAMGVETAVIPTAVLSAHTAFDGFTFFDLTSQIKPVAEHWKAQKIGFDAIYTGYMSSGEQIGTVSEFIDEFHNKDNLVIVDPAMADNGRLYAGFDGAFAGSMKTLVKKADVIVPNLTEACMLLDMDYPCGGYDEAYIKKLLGCLVSLGCRSAVITGVSFEKERLGAAVYDSGSGQYSSYFNKRCGRNFHGTGDIFASVMTGSLVNGMTLERAVKCAVDFTRECIDYTVQDRDAGWYGVDFEYALPWLIKETEEWRKTYGRK